MCQMNQKKIFMKELEKALSGVHANEKKDILNEYEIHFRDGAAAGKSEKEIADALGNPRKIGRAHYIEYMLDQNAENKNYASTARIVFATFALGFLNYIFVLSPFLGFLFVLFLFWILNAAWVVISALSIFSPLFVFIHISGNPIVASLLALASLSLGLLCLIGMVYLTKGFFNLTAKYIRFNIGLITHRR